MSDNEKGELIKKAILIVDQLATLPSTTELDEINIMKIRRLVNDAKILKRNKLLKL